MLAKSGDTGSLTVSEAADTAAFTGITVGEIAEALKTIEPNRPALIERIRAWTKQKILAPIGNLAAGTGKHLRYDDTTKYEVAALNAIATDGLHIAQQPYLRFALARLREELPKWQRRAKAKQTPPLFLVIKRPMAQAGALDPTADIVTKISVDRTTGTMHIVNLGQLFRRIGAG